MKIIEVDNYKELSKKASEILVKEIFKNPRIVIGFAAGKTPSGLYNELSKQNKKIDFSKMKAFILDEYYPIKKKNKHSFYHYMHKNLFNKLNIKKSNIHFLDGEAKNPDRECSDYEKKIRRKPIDIQILGVGVNGHIGFNEPNSDFNSKTRLVELSNSTIKKNSGIFQSGKIPNHALTMGIKTIMNSKKIILLVNGKEKANALRCLINGKIDKRCPISILRNHKSLVVISDSKALSLTK